MAGNSGGVALVYRGVVAVAAEVTVGKVGLKAVDEGIGKGANDNVIVEGCGVGGEILCPAGVIGDKEKYYAFRVKPSRAISSAFSSLQSR